jgi:hypothetical protein
MACVRKRRSPLELTLQTNTKAGGLLDDEMVTELLKLIALIDSPYSMNAYMEQARDFDISRM